ncbi:cysteine methyltransferase [Paenibacillus sp. 598K]|uniref:methylated-DNA--[protein]-cysteine S-methyltransferase n=1 Tax=Paenibacillus sp. 598K TaxID=1117987 RepID=UPI000FFAFFAB|nr:methylated-DNA--[protein]-cysteine S-methyltransferase [Paenibacillus sp. 598K]GBF71880.1 cysteine methyltransferase [Paenibacillus sp. 598K]
MATTSPNRSPLYWSVLENAQWRLHVAAAEDGLCFVGSLGESYDELAAWASRRLPEYDLIRDDTRLKPYAAALDRYIQGEQERFDMPLYYRGTPFQEAVWQALQAIPYGETRSYSEIAAQIGRPAAVRAVGAAIGANPILIAVPCHRVVGKSGALTGYRGGMPMKTRLLELEQSIVGQLG